ncbi:hypothetical protein ACF044_02010 [Microbacterium sp. NPDC016588]
MGLSIDDVRATGVRRDARQPIPVTARLQFLVAHVEPREVEAAAIAWADAAVLVRWTGEDGHEHYTWVYEVRSGGVDKRATESGSATRDNGAVMMEPADDATAIDREPSELVEGLVPIVTNYISREWDWRPWMTEPPYIGAGGGVPTARPPGWTNDDAWTVVYEGAYPWALGFTTATSEEGLRGTTSARVECEAGWAISVHRNSPDE